MEAKALAFEMVEILAEIEGLTDEALSIVSIKRNANCKVTSPSTTR